MTGCGRSLDGTYSGTSQNGITNISADFKPDGTVLVSTMGSTMQATYKIDGDKVTLTGNGQNQVMTLASDGSLSTGGPMGIVLRKK
jgi:hypothetical protein